MNINFVGWGIKRPVQLSALCDAYGATTLHPDNPSPSTMV